MCIDNLQDVCGELVHIFQRHYLKGHQTFLILSEKKTKLLTGQEDASLLTANPIPSRNREPDCI